MLSELVLMIEPPVRCGLISCPGAPLALAYQELADRERVAKLATDWMLAGTIKVELDEVGKRLRNFQSMNRKAICPDCPYF